VITVIGVASVILAALTVMLAGSAVWFLAEDGQRRTSLMRIVTRERVREQVSRSGVRTMPAWLVTGIRWCQPIGWLLSGAAEKAALHRKLRASGQPWGLDVRSYLGLRIFATISGILFGLLLKNPVMALMLGVGGWLGLEQWISGRVNDRQSQITADLPDFLDSVAVSLSAGAPVETALQEVTEQLDGPLQEEFRDVLAEIALGVPRQQAFRRLLDHNRSRELEAVVLSIIHGMQLGVPLSDALSGQAKAMRNTRAQRARQLAGAASPKITLVSTLMITPAVLFLIIGLLVLNFFFNKELSGFQSVLKL